MVVAEIVVGLIMGTLVGGAALLVACELFGWAKVK